MPPHPRRFYLKERTSEHHAAVDAAVGSFHTLEHYGTYLQGLLAFRKPLEQQLSDACWPETFDSWRPAPLTPSIMADMRDLNVKIYDVAPIISKATDLESVLGALYVLEGSSLGARILYVRAKELGLGEEFGARHLARQAESFGFKSFLKFLEDAPTLDMNKVVEASREAFHLAEAAFKERRECTIPPRSI